MKSIFKVKDLLSELQKYNPESEIVFYMEDDELNLNNGPDYLEISEITLANAVKKRLKDGKPSLEFNYEGVEHILIRLSSDM